MQQHAARRTHYDFRLEWGGVLKSWAVPKGPSPNPADKRLAVHVEDHPVDYVNFEGVIPPDNYGAGAVIVWDRGHWVALNDIAAGLDKGKLLFELQGHKLRGRWTLVKTKRGKNEWLLIKERDAYATTKSTEDYPHDSVLSGRTVEQVASGDPRGAAVAAKLRKLGAARRELEARDLRPMLATPGKPFSNPKWVFELKYDGYRLFAEKREGEVKLYSRAGNDFTATFPEIAEIVAALPFAQLIIDAEVVVLDDARLAELRSAAKARALDAPRRRRARGARAAGQHLRVRSARVRRLRSARSAARRAQGRVARAAAGVRCAALLGALRGARRGDVRRSRAHGARGHHRQTRRVAVRRQALDRLDEDQRREVGRLRRRRLPPPKQGGNGFGALLLAQYRDGVLTYAGRVGSGFAARDFAVLEPLLAGKPAAEPPAAAELARGDVWLADGPVVQVKFKQRTPDGMLRQPVFLRLRDDKKPAECVWQTEAGDVATAEGRAAEPRRRADEAARAADRRVHEPRQGVLAGRRLHEGRPDRVLPRRSPRGCCRT